MNRRKFISAFSKVSLVTATAGATMTATAKGNAVKPNRAAEGLSAKFEELRKRVDVLEEEQKDYLRAICLVTAFPTGLDLSFLI